MAFPWESGSGDDGINPTTGLPWDVYPDKASPTGYTHVPSGTHVYKDGAPYTGVTGSGVTVNVAAPVTWGPTQVDGDGSVTGAPGSTYQVNSRGDVSILTRGKAAAGDDGINDTTGLPNGVYPDKNSSTGYAYYGSGTPIPVQKDGADARPMGHTYSGGDGGSGAPNLVNGKYTWDPVAKKFVIAPGMEGTTSSSVSVSTPRVSSGSSGGGGGGGSSASSLSDQLSLISARASSEMDVAKYKNGLEYAYLMAKMAAENDPSNINNRIQLAQLELQVQQFNESVGQRNADRRVQLIKDYESAVSSPDLARLQARRMAIGGDATTASLLRDGANYRDNASAAALLAEIRGLAGSGNALGQIAASGLGIPAGTGAGGGMPTTAGVPGLPAATVPDTGGLPGAPSAPTMPTAPAVPGAVQAAINRAQREDAAAQAQWRAYHNPANWTVVASQNLTYGGAGTGDRYVNSVTGDKLTAQEYAQLMAEGGPQLSESEIMMGALQDSAILAGQQQGAALDPNAMVQSTAKTAQGSGGGTTLYNMPWGWSTTNQMTSPVWQTGGDRGVLQQHIDTDFGTPAAGPAGPVLAEEPVTNVLPQAVLPMTARGNMRPFPGAHIVGDPAVPGRPNPEVVQWTPRGNIVMPMSKLPQRTQQMAWRAMPKFARGTPTTTTAYPSDLYGGDESGFFQPEPAPYAPAPEPVAPTPIPMPVAAVPTPVSAPAVAPAPEPVAPTPIPVAAPAMIGPAAEAVMAPALPMAPMPAPVVTSPVATTVGSAPSPTTPAVAPTATTVPTVGSTTTTAPAPVTTPTPTTTTVGGDTVPTATEYDPLHPLAITPEAQGLMDEIDTFRDTFQFPDANTLDVAFLRAAPSYQKSALLGKQTKYGIPIEDWQAEMAKYYLAGRPRFAGVVGY